MRRSASSLRAALWDALGQEHDFGPGAGSRLRHQAGDVEDVEARLARTRDVVLAQLREQGPTVNLADAHTAAENWSLAIECAENGTRVADEIGSAQGSSTGRVTLATAYLQADAFDAALATAQAARDYDYAPMSDNVALILGIASPRQGRANAAREAFGEAVNAADALLARTPGAYDELDNRALALCGLAIVDDPARASEASEAFHATRRITRADGIVARVLSLFDTLADGEETGTLAPVRAVAAGVID